MNRKALVSVIQKAPRVYAQAWPVEGKKVGYYAAICGEVVRSSRRGLAPRVFGSIDAIAGLLDESMRAYELKVSQVMPGEYEGKMGRLSRENAPPVPRPVLVLSEQEELDFVLNGIMPKKKNAR